MKNAIFRLVLIAIFGGLVSSGQTQNIPERRFYKPLPHSVRVYDSLMASRVPELILPATRLKTLLPVSVDNTQNEYWPTLQDQYMFYSCQQYAGVAYTFGYEFNRMRDTKGYLWENRFAAHYTWNFLNEGGRYTGVNFLHSFDVIRQQGHMTNTYFGSDTAGSYLGWASGYDKYFSAMTHRLKNVFAINLNSENGINTLRNYLYDHLDGSSVGGIACFTTESWFEMGTLPPGTPEAGKSVELFWQPLPDHGLCIVGYNDSIRYDLNGDGQYTNNIDINYDGVVNAKDWEIGGFKFANSWGYWWCDEGYAYVLYSAMASDFENRGVWNTRAYIVEADTGFHPLLTLKTTIDYNKRQRIRVIAGVSSDTLAAFPEYTMTFPIFNFQGGDHVMNGFDDGPGPKSVEFGLDITPLLNYFPASGKARLFMGVDERDPDNTGSGTIVDASFIRYTGSPAQYQATTGPVTIMNNSLTLVSAVATVTTSRVQITTQELPPYEQGKSYQVQMQASAGSNPYSWSLRQNYLKQPFSAEFPPNTGVQLSKISDLRPYSVQVLPFHFPWYGKMCDTIYINFNGFVGFDGQTIPPPYITDEQAMFRMFPILGPAFSQHYTYVHSKNDGVFYHADASGATIWWKTSVQGYEYNSNNHFALRIYPDGRIEFYYGDMDGSPVLPTINSGMSKGDSRDFDIMTQWRADTLAGHALRYQYSPCPAEISITREGMLSVSQADTSLIYSIPVMVTDEENLFDFKLFDLSSGLKMEHQLICGDDGHLRFGEPANLVLTLRNNGLTALQNLEIRLRSKDAACMVTDSLITLPLLNPGEPVLLDPVFSFALLYDLPVGYPVRLSLDARCGDRNWQKLLDFPVAEPANNHPWVVFQSFQIIDPDGNGKLSTGETVSLNMTMKNAGDQPAYGVTVSLSCDSPYITLIDNEALFGDFAAGEVKTVENAFIIMAANNIPDATLIPFTLTATDGTGTWNSIFSIRPYAPALSIGNMTIVEIPPPSKSPHGSGILDPGEIADLIVSTSNNGGYVAADAHGELTCTSPFITVNSGSYHYGDLAVGVSQDAVFNVSVSPDAPLNTTVVFHLTVTSGAYTVTKDFVQKIGFVVEDFESGDFTRFPWTMGGNQPWTITDINPYEGIYSARSGNIGDNQTSSLHLQRNVTQPDTISFWFRTSTEAGYDYLKFFIDGTLMDQWSAENPWTRAVYPVTPGNHLFVWQYAKDQSVTGGTDCVCVDYIVMPTDAELGVQLSGTITYANTVSTPLAGINVLLKNNEGTVIKITYTDASGLYTFNVVPPGSYSFEVNAFRPWGGVTAADALLFRKHIANISPLHGIYLASGDVNATGHLTAADVLLIQKRIANITNSFPAGDWYFNHQPFTVGSTNIIQDFQGITYGDANGSYVPEINKMIASRRGTVSLGDASFSKDGIMVPVQLSDINDLGAFQFSVRYDAGLLKLTDIGGWHPEFGEVTTGRLAEGVITFVWAADTHGISLQDGILCWLVFTAEGGADADLSFNGIPTEIEFTAYDGTSFMPELTGTRVKTIPAEWIHTQDGLSVFPNPNNGSFNLSVTTHETTVNIRVINALGLVVLDEHAVSLDVSRTVSIRLDNQPEGVYLVTVDDGVKMRSGKIVIVK